VLGHSYSTLYPRVDKEKKKKRGQKRAFTYLLFLRGNAAKSQRACLPLKTDVYQRLSTERKEKKKRGGVLSADTLSLVWLQGASHRSIKTSQARAAALSADKFLVSFSCEGGKKKGRRGKRQNAGKLLGVTPRYALLFAAMGDRYQRGAIRGEAFQSWGGEAMACEIPCVVT